VALISRTELAKRLRVTPRCVGTWERLGCPSERPKGRGKGRPAVYDEDQVRAWLQKTGFGFARGYNRIAAARAAAHAELAQILAHALAIAYLRVLEERDTAVAADRTADLLQWFISHFRDQLGEHPLAPEIGNFLDRFPALLPASYEEAIADARAALGFAGENNAHASP
jgi:phage terminase Nu1 subunit (DNA packaging protein)